MTAPVSPASDAKKGFHRPTAVELGYVAFACRAFLAAHERRKPDYRWMTLREEAALGQLRDTVKRYGE